MSAQLIRVLLVTHDSKVLESVRLALRPEDDYELVDTATIDGAREELRHGWPDVILAHLPLPGTDGIGAIQTVVTDADRRPVIALTEAEGEALRARALHHGCSDFLTTRALEPGVVRSVIRSAVERARLERSRKQAERALAESEQRYRSLFEQSRDAIYMTERTGEILELNEAALDLLGYEADELIGRDVRMLYADPADRARFQLAIEASGHVREFELALRRKDGGERTCLVSSWVRYGPDDEVLGYQGIIHDISERKRIEEQLAHEALHDALTGLPNRALFMDRLERAVARRRRGEERELAVLFLDLDRFKRVNDSLGHMVGDELLNRIGRLLEEEVRDEDTVARMGGDEFAILLDGVDDPADPTHVAERIQERLRTPFQLRGHDVFTSFSIGITLGGGEVQAPEDLLRDADTAMYRAKELGPARYQIFDEAMHVHAISMLQLENDLRLALDRGEFLVHYQPVLDPAGDLLIGFESLLRWNHPERGILQPAAFIPIAEDSGQIVPIGEWALRTAVRQLADWRALDRGATDLIMSVNLSPRQFARPDLVELVRDVLETAGIPGPALRLELPERVIMENPDRAGEALRRLRDLGVGLCIDDFGTGYSALSHLHELPIDTLKIDRSFISRIEEHGQSEVVATIVALATALGMQAMAVGVETRSQLSKLQTLHTAGVQGFLFSTPVDAAAAERLLPNPRG
jgi:diguanylate cyclase (GGDEF)-like protein/PAS domain S-box-containing protein